MKRHQRQCFHRDTHWHGGADLPASHCKECGVSYLEWHRYQTRSVIYAVRGIFLGLGLAQLSIAIRLWHSQPWYVLAIQIAGSLPSFFLLQYL